MKKLLLSSLMAVSGLFAMNAAEVTVHFPDACAGLLGGNSNVVVTTFEAEGFTFSFAKNGGSTDPAYYQYINNTTGKDEGSIRLYAQNSMTITAPQGATINAVDFTLAGGTWNCGDDASAYPVSEGSFVFSYADKTANWTGLTGNEATISVTGNKNQAGKLPQLRVMSLNITYTEGEVTKCSNPKFGLNEGTYYTAQNVELTCNTNGATIMYQINDGAETEYTTPIALSELGSYTITAYAKKDGIDSSDKVSATYTIAAPVEVSSLAEFQSEGEANDGNIMYKFAFPVTVTYQNASNLYVKDAEGGAMLIYGNQVPKYEVGDIIPAGIMGEYTSFNGLPEMQYPEASTFAPATQNVPTYPIAMKAGDITLSDLNKVVVVTGKVDATGKVVTDATGSLSLFYQKAWNVETPAEGEYDVVCAVAVYNTGIQAYPIAFNEPGSGVNDAVAEATTVVATANGIAVNAAEACTVVVYNAAGQAVETVNVAAGESTVNVPAGFYIVKAANTVCKVLVK